MGSTMIRWTAIQTAHGETGENGHVGEIRGWTVTYNGIRNRDDPNHYVLSCFLPGIKARVPVETAEAGRARAEGAVAGVATPGRDRRNIGN